MKAPWRWRLALWLLLRVERMTRPYWELTGVANDAYGAARDLGKMVAEYATESDEAYERRAEQMNRRPV